MSKHLVEFHGFVFDPIDDDEARKHAARARAEALVSCIHRTDALRQLEDLVTGLLSYHIQAAATVCIAHAGGAAGITIRQALDQLNYIGQLVGEEELVIERVEGGDGTVGDVPADAQPVALLDANGDAISTSPEP